MNRLNINNELEQIIEKYNLDRHYPAYRVSRRACDYMSKWIKKLSSLNQTFTFISMDEHALKLINDWARNENSKNISTLLISSVEELGDFCSILKKADKLYIVSYTRTIEILHWLWRHDFHAESIYDVLENEHIYLQMEFYRFFTPLKMSPELELYEKIEEKSIDGSALILYEYYYQKQRFLHSLCDKDKRRFTEKLFFLAICMRNFLDAEKILNTMSDATEFKLFWDELQQLFVRVREILSSKQEKNIIIYWLDALAYDESKDMKYLQSRRMHSVHFSNAYAETPLTNPVCRSMFCQLRQVDDLGYNTKEINFQNSPLLRDITAQGYEFSVVSAYLGRLFDSKNNHCVGVTKEDSASAVFWNLLDQILQSRQKTVYLAHAFVELHDPNLSVRRERFESQFQYKEASRKKQRKELDEQLRFYDEWLGDGFYRIYMSDHGFGSDNRMRMHVHFQIYHSSWQSREIEKLFCFLDFTSLMHLLLIGKKIDDSICNREYVPVQDVDHYNQKNLKIALSERKQILPFVAYKGAVTKEGIYLKFKTGDEIFNKWTEYITDVRAFLYSTRKNLNSCGEICEKVGGFPKELDSDPKFQYSIYIYKAYANVKRTIQAVAKLINEKIGRYTDGSIVLRMGGLHSCELYEMMTEDNRKKIGGIIDKNKKCSSSSLGFHTFLPGERLPDKIEAVVLSSYIFLEELKIEAKEIYSGLEIIDIYQYLKEAGYNFKREFWFGLDSDYEVGFPKD